MHIQHALRQHAHRGIVRIDEPVARSRLRELLADLAPEFPHRVVAEAAGRGRLTVRTRTGYVAGSTP